MHTSSPFLVNDFLKIEHMQDVPYFTLETRDPTVSGLENNEDDQGPCAAGPYCPCALVSVSGLSRCPLSQTEAAPH